MRSIDEAITRRSGPVRFRWVRGHVGNHYNEIADTLAGAAARAIADGKPPAEVATAPAAATRPPLERPADEPPQESPRAAPQTPVTAAEDALTLF